MSKDGIKTFKPYDISDDEPEVKQHTYADRERLGHLYGGPRWKVHTQPVVLRRDPICVRCRVAMAEIVDHIVPAGVAIQQAVDSGKWPFDRTAGFFLLSNLQGLCRPCHGLKTNEDKAHSGPWPSVVETESRAPKKRWSF
jgi:5-methylcytosine-specific restriction endonuclease McrA